MKSLSVVACLCVSVLVQAQTYGDLHGTWINAQFMELLRRTASVASAMEAVSPRYPLWVVIDSSNADGNVRTAFDFEESVPLLLMKGQIMGSELRWGLGDEVAPRWLVTVDQQQHTYLALHGLDSLKGIPYVLGKLPSKNQDPDFLIDRMINASVLAGTYLDRSKKPVEFRTDMTVVWAGRTYSTKIDVKKTSHQLHVILTAADGKQLNYLVERVGSGLSLTKPDGTVEALSTKR